MVSARECRVESDNGGVQPHKNILFIAGGGAIGVNFRD